MALLTPLSVDAAHELCAAYGLKLARIQALRAGSVNSNFFLFTKSGGSYFGRIYEEQGDAGAQFELTLNERLHDAGLPVARPLRVENGELFTRYLGKPFALYERIDGEILCQGLVGPAACRAVGQSLARVHLADLGELSIPEGRFGFEQMRERLEVVRRSRRQDLLPAVDRIERLIETLSAERSQQLPGGLIHGDLFRDNVLVSSSAADSSASDSSASASSASASSAVDVRALLDFESACRGPFVYDLMVTVLAWCFDSELRADLSAALVGGYHELRPLRDDEREEMTREGSVACVRFATTRLTDFSLRTAPGQPPSRDYRRFLQRLEALQSGALDRALASVF